MALLRGRATSRCTGQIYRIKTATSAVWLCLCLLFPSAAEAGLYSSSDQVILLTPENVESVLVNSTAAIVAEFYASWCGHCVAFSPVYKSLARDIKGWYRPAASHVAATATMEIKFESYSRMITHSRHCMYTILRFSLSLFYSNDKPVFRTNSL